MKALLLLSVSLALGASSCFLDDVGCDPDQEARYNFCFPMTEAAGGESSAPDGEAGAAGAPPSSGETNWAEPCTSNDECGGDSPLCAQAPLSYCTNTDCAEGEANEGICPEGWVCFPKGFRSPDDPSACVKQ